MRIEKTKDIFIKKEKNTSSFIYVIIFSFAVILKFGYYRFSYFPILDDYIQYGSYHLYDKSYVLLQIGTIYTRPIAGLCDLYLWGLFRDNLSIVFIIITAMHLVSAFLFKRAFEKAGIQCGSMFLIFYLLSPILSEAVYWISASARIVPSLLFCALSLHLLCEYLKQKKLYLWLLTFLTHLISYGFYEQTMCLSFAVFVFLIFVYPRTEKRISISALMIPIICAVAFLVYYIIFRDTGSYSDRTAISFSFSQVFGVIKRLFRIGTVQNLELTSNGFIRGLSLLAKKPIYLMFVILSSIIFLFLPKEHFKISFKKIVLGVIILTFPYFPYLILRESYPEFRSMYTSVIGTGIILDAVSGKLKYKNILCMCLAFVFITANVSEMHDYREVYDTDQKILEEIALSDNLTEHTDIYVTGAKEYYTKVNSRLGAHISNITSSDWALTGAVRSYTKNADIKRLIPVYENNTELLPQINISHIK